MKIYKNLVLLSLSAALFSGCSMSMQNAFVSEDIKSDKKTSLEIKKNINNNRIEVSDCSAINTKKSLEQNIKNIANNLGFVARIHNLTTQNPIMEDIKNVHTLNAELEKKGLEFKIENFADDSEVKNVYIAPLRSDLLINQLKAIEFTFESNILSAGELIRIFALKRIHLIMPIYLNSKVIKINSEQSYSLYELVNQFTQNLANQELFVDVTFNDEFNRVVIEGKPYAITGNNQTLRETAKKLLKYGVPFKNEIKAKQRLVVKGTLEEIVFAKKIANKQAMYDKNKYQICFKEKGQTYTLLARNNQKINLNYQNSILVSKLSESNFGEETYAIYLYEENIIDPENKNAETTNKLQKKFLLKTNKKRVSFEDLNRKKIKVLLY